MEINKIAEFQYNWLKNLLKPLFNKLTLENVRKYKNLIKHNRSINFKNLDEETKKIYIDFAKELKNEKRV